MNEHNTIRLLNDAYTLFTQSQQGELEFNAYFDLVSQLMMAISNLNETESNSVVIVVNNINDSFLLHKKMFLKEKTTEADLFTSILDECIRQAKLHISEDIKNATRRLTHI